MYLAKHPTNRIYYLWYLDELGQKQEVSTKCMLKGGALKFLQRFKQDDHDRKSRQHRLMFTQFKQESLTYAETNRTVSSLTDLMVLFDIVDILPR